MIKVNVRCVPLVRRLHELALQSVKIVVLVDTVMVAKNANLASIAPLLWTILKDALTAVLGSLNQMMGKRAVSLVYLAHIKMNLVNQYVKNVTQDCIVDPKMLSVANVRVVGYQQNQRR